MKFKSLRDRLTRHMRKTGFKLMRGSEYHATKPHYGCAIGLVADSYGIDGNSTATNVRRKTIEVVGSIENAVHLEVGFEDTKYISPFGLTSIQ